MRRGEEHMSIEAMKQALDALEYLDVTAEHYVDDRIAYAAITALRQAIEQAEKQEPVIDKSAAIRIATVLGWTPPRQWVGLTDEEIDVIYEAHHNQYGECETPNFGYERAIEAKLKEKNGYAEEKNT
jgi:hypothetical protein